MQEPDLRPSQTARRVAAYRARFERLEGPDGRPDDDRRLTADVAGDDEVDPGSSMGRYLRARTGFFDRVVVNAVERHNPQIVSVGAGYDGRAFRYEAAGVRWFEVDRADTQRDKLARIDRLGLDRSGITFVEHDLDDPGLAAKLIAAGFDPELPALMIAEGLLVYLSAPAVDGMLADLRSLATPGARFAMSVRTERESSSVDAFVAAATAVGEPPANTLGPDSAPAVFERHRWTPVQLSDRARSAGFVVLRPEWRPGSPPTAGAIGSYLDRIFGRVGVDTLAAHLAAAHGVRVRELSTVAPGVFRVDLEEGTSWVARVFPVSTPRAASLHRPNCSAG